jgi:cytochrome c oxidase subunit 2
MKLRLVSLIALIAALALSAGISAYVLAHPRQRIVLLSVKRFAYSPNEIVLRKGEAVVLEVQSEDVVHGFNAPDLGVRTDVVPGKLARVQLTPQKAGRFGFHCDIFCGTGHEELVGTIVVTE